MDNDLNEVRFNMFNILSEKDPEFDAKIHQIEISKLPSLSNNAFHVQIISKDSHAIIKEYLYKKYGEISECIDHEIEEEIISQLFNDDLAPKIFYSDPDKKFRVEEFINTLDEDDKEEKDTDGEEEKESFQSDLIDQIIQICLSYSLISKIYIYTMRTTNDIFQKLNIVIDADESSENIKNNKRRNRLNTQKNIRNFFDFVVEDLYVKAMDMFNQFASKAQENLNEESNKDLFDEILLLKVYLNNFRSMVQEVFPKKGYMTLSHNSIRDKNLLKANYRHKKSHYMVIDHEFASLNLLGYDIVNYMNESLFEYLPKYKFKEDNYDFNYFYSVFQRYMEKFKDAHPELVLSPNREREIDDSEKYFTQLFCLNHLFWMLYCCVYLNFDNYVNNKGFNFLQHAIDRVKCYEIGMKKLEEMNEDDDEGFVIYV